MAEYTYPRRATMVFVLENGFLSVACTAREHINHAAVRDGACNADTQVHTHGIHTNCTYIFKSAAVKAFAVRHGTTNYRHGMRTKHVHVRSFVRCALLPPPLAGSRAPIDSFAGKFKSNMSQRYRGRTAVDRAAPNVVVRFTPPSSSAPRRHISHAIFRRISTNRPLYLVDIDMYYECGL